MRDRRDEAFLALEEVTHTSDSGLCCHVMDRSETGLVSILQSEPLPLLFLVRNFLDSRDVLTLGVVDQPINVFLELQLDLLLFFGILSQWW